MRASRRHPPRSPLVDLSPQELYLSTRRSLVYRNEWNSLKPRTRDSNETWGYSIERQSQRYNDARFYRRIRFEATIASVSILGGIRDMAFLVVLSVSYGDTGGDTDAFVVIVTELFDDATRMEG